MYIFYWSKNYNSQYCIVFILCIVEYIDRCMIDSMIFDVVIFFLYKYMGNIEILVFVFFFNL